jgi:hypothetical protein
METLRSRSSSLDSIKPTRRKGRTYSNTPIVAIDTDISDNEEVERNLITRIRQRNARRKANGFVHILEQPLMGLCCGIFSPQ